jgi:hypothetical protein
MIKRQPVTVKFILAVPSASHSIFPFAAAAAWAGENVRIACIPESRGCSALIGSLKTRHQKAKSYTLVLIKEI